VQGAFAVDSRRGRFPKILLKIEPYYPIAGMGFGDISQFELDS
jgi:hypothetical protein